MPKSNDTQSQLTDLQQAMVEHDDDMARLDRNTRGVAQPEADPVENPWIKLIGKYKDDPTWGGFNEFLKQYGAEMDRIYAESTIPPSTVAVESLATKIFDYVHESDGGHAAEFSQQRLIEIICPYLLDCSIADDLVQQLIAIDGPCNCAATLCEHWKAEAGIILTAALLPKQRAREPQDSEIASAHAVAQEIDAKGLLATNTPFTDLNRERLDQTAAIISRYLVAQQPVGEQSDQRTKAASDSAGDLLAAGHFLPRPGQKCWKCGDTAIARCPEDGGVVWCGQPECAQHSHEFERHGSTSGESEHAPTFQNTKEAMLYAQQHGIAAVVPTDEIARLNSEVERLKESELFWKIDALGHFCSDCGDGDKRQVGHYCAGCGGPMAWKTKEGRKTYKQICADRDSARADAIKEAVEALSKVRSKGQNSTGRAILASDAVAALEALAENKQ